MTRRFGSDLELPHRSSRERRRRKSTRFGITAKHVGEHATPLSLEKEAEAKRLLENWKQK